MKVRSSEFAERLDLVDEFSGIRGFSDTSFENIFQASKGVRRFPTSTSMMCRLYGHGRSKINNIAVREGCGSVSHFFDDDLPDGFDSDRPVFIGLQDITRPGMRSRRKEIDPSFKSFKFQIMGPLIECRNLCGIWIFGRRKFFRRRARKEDVNIPAEAVSYSQGEHRATTEDPAAIIPVGTDMIKDWKRQVEQKESIREIFCRSGAHSSAIPSRDGGARGEAPILA